MTRSAMRRPIRLHVAATYVPRRRRCKAVLTGCAGSDTIRWRISVAYRWLLLRLFFVVRLVSGSKVVCASNYCERRCWLGMRGQLTLLWSGTEEFDCCVDLDCELLAGSVVWGDIVGMSMFLSVPVANLLQIHFPYSIAPALAAAGFTDSRPTSAIGLVRARASSIARRRNSAG